MSVRAFAFAPPQGAAGVEQLPVNAWWHPRRRLLVDLGYAYDTAWMRDVGDVATVLVTHGHPDHAGGAGAAARAFPGAARHAPEPARLADAAAAFAATADGDRLHDGAIETLRTPGHSPDHAVYLDHAEGALYAGDLVLGSGTPWVGPPEGALADYMASLERVLRLAPRVIYPGHGPACDVAQAQWTFDHRRRRLDQVLAALAAGGPADAAALVDRIYVQGEGLTMVGAHRVVADLTMRGYLDFLAERGQVVGDAAGRFALR